MGRCWKRTQQARKRSMRQIYDPVSALAIPWLSSCCSWVRASLITCWIAIQRPTDWIMSREREKGNGKKRRNSLHPSTRHWKTTIIIVMQGGWKKGTHHQTRVIFSVIVIISFILLSTLSSTRRGRRIKMSWDFRVVHYTSVKFDIFTISCYCQFPCIPFFMFFKLFVLVLVSSFFLPFDWS